ncbi:MAG TPA: methionyl-tRNA formyltransferase [Candidatus Limnocylindria bacterium]|nr:methionyl-tRNA formyltransferase [Candidatus Limnocylindria bacterium]
MSSPTRTVFVGSGAFAVPVIDALSNAVEVDLVAVVTAPTRPGSRGRPTDPPVADWATDHGLPMLRPEKLRTEESIGAVAELFPDLLVLADYGQIVPAALLELPRFGALNLHPSLLPRHRGASPIPAAILADDHETGVSLMLMDAGLDSGPLVARRRFPLSGSETAPELEHTLANVAAELLTTTLPSWLSSDLMPLPQEEEGVTLTRPLRRSDGRLDPQRDAIDLERQVRAYQPWPGTFFETHDGRAVIWKARVMDGDAAPGTIVDGPAIATANGLLELVEVQPAGGRRMSGEELVRGRPGFIGSTIE